MDNLSWHNRAEERLVARIQRDDGRMAQVLPGPESEISRKDLRDAGQVTVAGYSGRVNDRPMLVADLIVVDGETIRVDNRVGCRLKRVKGEVLSTRTANFRGYDAPFLIGRVELQGGDRSIVNFGPRERIEERLRLREGTPVSLLVRPGRINGQQALIAEQIHADDRTVEWTRRRDRRRFQRSSEVTAEERSRPEERTYRGRDQREGERGEERGTERDAKREEQRQEERDEERGEQRPFTYGGEERAALGILVAEGEQGMEIARVIEGSPADNADLQVGDQLLSIDDTQTDTYRKVVRTTKTIGRMSAIPSSGTRSIGITG